MNEQEPTRTGEQPLESWKEIATYLQRDATTVRRWEKKEGLPVYRHSHQRGSSVYAYPSEIDSWRAGRKVAAEPAPVRTLWRWPAFAATMLLCLVMVGNGVRPVSAQQAGQAARQLWTGPEVDSYGSVSADGRYMSFANWETGDLALRDFATNTTRMLTNTGGWYASGDYTDQSVLSADGRQVAYHWFTEKESRDEVRILSVNDGTVRSLPQSSNVRYALPYGWTPDAKELLEVRTLVDRTWQIVMVSTRDGSARVLKSLGWTEPSASLSPDGRYVVYEAADQKTANRDLFVLSADGSSEAVAVRNPADDHGPIWSPDGSRILFLSDRTGNNSVWAEPIKKGQPAGPAQIVRADSDAARLIGMSRTGTLYYAAESTAFNIYTVRLGADGKVMGAPEYAVDTFLGHNFGPRWSPSGEELAYYSDRPGSPSAVVIRNMKTGEERAIPIAPLQLHINGSSPRWFPDGRSLLLLAREPQKPRVAFYRLDLTSGKYTTIHRIANGGLQGFDLSADGKTIFYTEGLASKDTSSKPVKRIVMANLETGQEKELARGSWFMALSVSPDGRDLAYIVSETGGTSSIRVRPVEGGEEREVYRSEHWYDGTRFSNPEWTADQRDLLFSKPDGSSTSLWRVPAAGGEAKRILSMHGQGPIHTIRSPQMQPGGTALTFSTLGGATEIWTLVNFLPKSVSGE